MHAVRKKKCFGNFSPGATVQYGFGEGLPEDGDSSTSEEVILIIAL